ncbi:MAG: hypothetical protein GX097_03150 [Methanomicrobiales archaeon]|nr:hypothetical protein [Methanomicrobiales archaeon]
MGVGIVIIKNIVRRYAVCLALLVFLSSFFIVGVNSQAGTEPGYYIVHWYNYDDAEVYFDDEYKGTINGSELFVEVDPTAPAYRRYTITKEGHATFTGYIDSVPAPGEEVDLHLWYVQIEPPESEGMDNDRGWYVVHEIKSREGSSVYFDGKYMGEIADGTLRVEVNLTESGFTEYRVVEPDGWRSHTMQVQHIPQAGETVHYYAWVQLAPRPPPMYPGQDMSDSSSPTPATTSGTNADGEEEKTPGFGIGLAIFGLMITACEVRKW